MSAVTPKPANAEPRYRCLGCKATNERSGFRGPFDNRKKTGLLHWREVEYQTYTKCGPVVLDGTTP